MVSRKYTGLILLVGMILVIAGVMTGEATIVYEKAIRICMECIGIG